MIARQREEGAALWLTYNPNPRTNKKINREPKTKNSGETVDIGSPKKHCSLKV